MISGVEGDGFAVDREGAVVRGVVAGEHAQQRGLPGAVLAHEREHFAGAEVEGDLVEGRHAGESLADPLDGQHRHRGGCGHGSAAFRWQGGS